MDVVEEKEKEAEQLRHRGRVSQRTWAKDLGSMHNEQPVEDHI